MDTRESLDKFPSGANVGILVETTEKIDTVTDDKDPDITPVSDEPEIVTELNYRDNYIHTRKDKDELFDVTSIAIMKNPGYILICDRGNKTIKLIDNMFNVIQRHAVVFEPYDVAIIDHEYVVVTFPFVRLVQYLKIKDGPRLFPWLPVKSQNEYYSICGNKDNIVAICLYDNRKDSKTPCVHVMDRNGVIEHIISSNCNGDIFVDPVKIAMDSSTQAIYVSDRGRPAVISFSISGDVLAEYFMFSCEPSGISVDSSTGNIYVNNVSEHCIIQLNSSLKKMRTIKAKNNESMNIGVAIAYSSQTEKLFVAISSSPFVRVFML